MVTKKQSLRLKALHRLGLYTKRDVAKAIVFTDSRRSPVIEYPEGLNGVVEPPQNMGTIIKLCLHHEVLRTPQEAIIREALRNSYDIAPRYMCKCKDCGAEYQNLKTKCSTPECESTEFTYPDYSQKQKVELLLKQPNRDNTLDQINETLLRCMLGPDDHWLSFQQGVLSPERVSPVTVYIEDVLHMAVVWSEENGTVGNGEYFCSKCTKANPKEVYKKGEACKHCGGSADKETAYVYKDGSEIKARFSRDEIYHGITHPWLPYFYGNSLVVTALKILMSTTAMDNFNYDNYSTGKLAQILVFMGLSQSDADDLAAAVKRKTDGETQLNLMQQLGVDSRAIHAKAAELRTLYLAGKEGVTAVNTMQDSEKMQSLEWWKLWREIVNALYGVQDVAAGAMQQGTTGQNPRMKLDINNNTTEFYQRKLEAAWNWVFERMAVTDWVYKCRPVEEKDEAQDQAILTSKLNNIKLAIDLGMTAELTDEGEVKISGQPETLEDKQKRAMETMQAQAKLAPEPSESAFEGKQPFKKENVFATEKGKKWLVIESPREDMSKASDEGKWVTINGVHVLIQEGETVSEAFKRTTGKELKRNTAQRRKDVLSVLPNDSNIDPKNVYLVKYQDQLGSGILGRQDSNNGTIFIADLASKDFQYHETKLGPVEILDDDEKIESMQRTLLHEVHHKKQRDLKIPYTEDEEIDAENFADKMLYGQK